MNSIYIIGGMCLKILNENNLPETFVWRDDIGLITKSLGMAASSEKLYVNIDYVPPKAYSTKYHSHSQQEEFFLILEGSGTLRLNEEEYQVKKGDFISKPAGQNIAHTFYNSSSTVLAILDVGTKEKEDTCYYPDEKIFMHKCNGTKNIYKQQDTMDSWSSDPNENVR